MQVACLSYSLLAQYRVSIVTGGEVTGVIVDRSQQWILGMAYTHLLLRLLFTVKVKLYVHAHYVHAHYDTKKYCMMLVVISGIKSLYVHCR